MKAAQALWCVAFTVSVVGPRQSASQQRSLVSQRPRLSLTAELELEDPVGLIPPPPKAVGVWARVSEHVSVGLEVRYKAETDNRDVPVEQTFWRLSPGARYYFVRPSAVAPFLWTRFDIEIQRATVKSTRPFGNRDVVSIGGGIGAEWFVRPQVSLSMWTGIRFGRTIDKSLFTNSTVSFESNWTFVETVHSLVNLQVYF